MNPEAAILGSRLGRREAGAGFERCRTTNGSRNLHELIQVGPH
jgi:hypothetical protein